MTRLANEYGAINLSQGFPNFPCPDVLKDAAARAIRDDMNQYAITWGAARLRNALAAKYQEWYGLAVDPTTQVTVTCGATEAMVSALLGIVNPGDEVVVFEPFYENYGPDAILCDAKPVFVPMPADGPIDLDRLAKAFTAKTRAIIVCTPNNPTGRVLSRAELTAIAELCQRHDAFAVTDEIYEHIYYEGEHIPIATLPGMADRTITTSGASKTFSVTGWRIGTIISPPDVTGAIRKVHDFLTVGAAAPLQEAVAVGMETLGDDYYEGLARDYRRRRDILCAGLVKAGFKCRPPQGAYYVMADFSGLSILPDRLQRCHRILQPLLHEITLGAEIGDDAVVPRGDRRIGTSSRVADIRERLLQLLEPAAHLLRVLLEAMDDVGQVAQLLARD